MAKTENGVVGTTAGTSIQVQAGQNILLDAATADLVVFSQDGSDLIITAIADGNKIVLEDFFSQATTDLPPQLTLSDGSVITAAEVTGLVEQFDPNLVTPAAGPGAGGQGGGGAGFGDYDDDGIGDGIGISGLLEGTGLEFPEGEIPEELQGIVEDAGVDPEQPVFRINEIGLSSDLNGEYSDSATVDALAALGNPAIDSFLSLAEGSLVNYIELFNYTDTDQSTGGNDGVSIEGVLTLNILGPDGATLTIGLPTVTVPAGGHLVIMQAAGEAGVETVYVVFDASGSVVDAGDVPDGTTAWPVGTDTTAELGVILSWDLNGEEAALDTFLANGAAFDAGTLEHFWTSALGTTEGLDIFGDNGSFNGQISTQEVVAPGIFDAYAPISLEQLVECSPIAETFFLDINVNNIFARVDQNDSDTEADWTTGQTPSIGTNDVVDPNPQDPFNDDMNPGQPTGPDAAAGEDTDSNGQNIIIAGTNAAAFTNDAGEIEGGRAQDFLFGDEGENVLKGGSHNDFLDGGAGNDMLLGESGGDVIIDDQGQDMLVGGTGTDILFGRRAPGEEVEDTMDGGEGNDFFPTLSKEVSYFDPSAEEGDEIGNEDGGFEFGTGDLLIGDEIMEGGFGNDFMYGGQGNDFMYGGEGNDTIGSVDDEQQTYMRDIIVAGDGSDIIYGDNAGLETDFTPADIDALYGDIMDLMYYNGPYSFAYSYRSYVEWNYGGADLIYGGWGDDIIFGQGGDDAILAGHGDDIAAGGSGDDKIRGNGGHDSLYGDSGDDTMFGDAGSDFMMGMDDNDEMHGGAGNDYMEGNDGNDLMYGDAEGDVMYGNEGNDEMHGGAGNDFMKGGGGADTMHGGDDNDIMYGDEGNDVMYGGAGEDHMKGGGGADNMFGDTDSDRMEGGSGNDTMRGGSGNDRMNGDTDNDVLYGDDGVDVMYGDEGHDTLYGGADRDFMNGDDFGGLYGNDLMYGEDGDDVMRGQGGNDTMLGDADDDYMEGNDGNDVMHGGSGNDLMYGNDDDDLMYGDEGDDYMEGGAGADTLYGGSGSFDVMYGNDDADLMFGDDGNNAVIGDNDIMDGGAGNDVMFGEGGADTMFGGTGNDTMSGGHGNDVMFGDNGDDSMAGNAGDDTMSGGIGNDTMTGDDGDDVMYGGFQEDSMSGGSGNDLMYGDRGDSSTGGGVEDDTMHGGANNDTMYGEDDADLMYGDAGNDLMYGEDGFGSSFGGGEDDTMYGGDGHDSMYGEDEDDVMYGGTGNDVMSGGVGNDLMYGDDDSDVMYGNDGRDSLYGDEGDDYMEGGADADTMFGGTGNDAMSGGGGNDLMFGEQGNDVMSGGAGFDVMFGGVGSFDSMNGGADGDLMYGDSGTGGSVGDDDIMSGGSGNDTMFGEGGGDVMTGGIGNDIMTGGDGNDDLHGNAGDDVLRWTMADNSDGTDDIYDGDGNTDTLELYFTQAEFDANEEALAEFANRVENGEDNVTLTAILGGKTVTLTASDIEYVAVHVDGDEVPVLIDDTITTDEDSDITATITATIATPEQDFIPNDAGSPTTFHTPGAVTLTMPGGTPLIFVAAGWAPVGSVWTMTLVDGADDYGSLIFNATDPENVTVTLDIPEGVSIYDPMNVPDVASIVFDYSGTVEGIEDATVTINVNGTNDAPIAVDDIVITNVAGNIFVPEYAMLVNDIDIDDDDDSLFVDSVAAPATDVGYYAQYDVQSQPASSYEYDVSDDGLATDTGEVFVTYENSSVLVGGDANEIIIGGDGADTIAGGNGEDTIIGGGGDDDIAGQAGEDTFHYMNTGDGEDTIFFYDETEDVINLDALFDVLGAGSAEDRADLINLVDDGTDTVITIDGQANFTITLDDTTLGNHDGDLSAQDLLDQTGIMVSDES